MIDWSGSCKNRRETEVRSGGCGASGAWELWIRDVVLNLAEDKGILDHNGDIHVVLPAERELQLAKSLPG